MSPLGKRILSSIALLLILSLDYFFFRTLGLVVLGAVFILAGVFEYQRMVFAPFKEQTSQRLWFMFNCFVILILNLNSNTPGLSAAIVLLVISTAGMLWLHKNSQNNIDLLNVIAFSVLGYFYCVLVPIFALKILLLDHGLYWFIYLCAIIFTGDIMAYLGGRLCGKRKLQPNISPNKTIEGAVTGFIGSLLAAAVVRTVWLPFAPMWQLVSVAALCALLAQSGDFFESLLKRVANVKDSGAMMPGHGGVLDRLDGLYFAAPVVYFAAQSIQ